MSVTQKGSQDSAIRSRLTFGEQMRHFPWWAIIMIAGLVLLTVLAVGKVGGLARAFGELAAVEGGKYVQTPGVWGWPGLVSFSMIVSFGVWGMPQLIVRFYSIQSPRMLRLGQPRANLVVPSRCTHVQLSGPCLLDSFSRPARIQPCSRSFAGCQPWLV